MLLLLPLLFSPLSPLPLSPRVQSPPKIQSHELATRHLVSLRRNGNHGQSVSGMGLLIRRSDQELVLVAPSRLAVPASDADEGSNLEARFSRSEVWIPATVFRQGLPGLPSFCLLTVRLVEYPGDPEKLFHGWSGTPGLPPAQGEGIRYPVWDRTVTTNLVSWHQGRIGTPDSLAKESPAPLRFLSFPGQEPLPGNPLFDAQNRLFGVLLEATPERNARGGHFYRFLRTPELAAACARGGAPFAFPPDPLRSALEAAVENHTDLTLCVTRKGGPVRQEWAALRLHARKTHGYPCSVRTPSGKGMGLLGIDRDGLRLTLPKRPALFFGLAAFASEDPPPMEGALVLSAWTGDRHAWLAIPRRRVEFAGALILDPKRKGPRTPTERLAAILRWQGDAKALSSKGTPLRFPLDLPRGRGAGATPLPLPLPLPDPTTRWRLLGTIRWSDLAPSGAERELLAAGEAILIRWEGGKRRFPVPADSVSTPVDLLLPSGIEGIELLPTQAWEEGFLRLEALRFLPAPADD